MKKKLYFLLILIVFNLLLFDCLLPNNKKSKKELINKAKNKLVEILKYESDSQKYLSENYHEDFLPHQTDVGLMFSVVNENYNIVKAITEFDNINILNPKTEEFVKVSVEFYLYGFVTKEKGIIQVQLGTKEYYDKYVFKAIKNKITNVYYFTTVSNEVELLDKKYLEDFYFIDTAIRWAREKAKENKKHKKLLEELKLLK